MNRIIAFTILLLAVHAGAKPESQPQPVKGTHIVVTAPPGFVAADRFTGFLSEESGASIMVSELLSVSRNCHGVGRQGPLGDLQTDHPFVPHDGGARLAKMTGSISPPPVSMTPARGPSSRSGRT
jgi:hypothetical protein